MRWLGRGARTVALPFPRLDGSTWPDRRSVRAGFAASTLYDVVRREAFDPETHDVVDVLVAELLPLLDLGVSPSDEAHMRQVCSAAAQLGAAVGRVERRGGEPPAGTTRADAAAALWLACEDLPRLAPRQREVARYAVQCGYYLARTDPGRAWELTAALWEERHPAVRTPPPDPASD